MPTPSFSPGPSARVAPQCGSLRLFAWRILFHQVFHEWADTSWPPRRSVLAGRMRASSLSWVFLALAVVGTVVPLAAFVPWLLQHGLDLPRFIEELFSSRVSAFFAWDVVISAVAVLVAAVAVPGLSGARRTVVCAGTLLVGVSCGLPLLLFFWVRGGVVR